MKPPMSTATMPMIVPCHQEELYFAPAPTGANWIVAVREGSSSLTVRKLLDVSSFGYVTRMSMSHFIVLPTSDGSLGMSTSTHGVEVWLFSLSLTEMLLPHVFSFVWAV